MSEIAVVGKESFCTGFRLAGIRKIVEVGLDAQEDIDSVTKDPDVGIVALDHDIFIALHGHKRDALMNMVRPIIVPVSSEDSNEELRKMIKKSVGVDLWEKK